MRAPFRLGLQSSIDHGLDTGRIVSRFAAPAWSDRPKRLETAAAEALSPQTHGLAVHAIVSRDRNLGFASGYGQNDTRP
jgi:hypothetical protein